MHQEERVKNCQNVCDVIYGPLLRIVATYYYRFLKTDLSHHFLGLTFEGKQFRVVNEEGRKSSVSLSYDLVDDLTENAEIFLR